MKKLCRSVYINSMTVSETVDEDQACKMFLHSKEKLKDDGFNLRKFHSNSVLVQARVNPEANSEPAFHEPGLTLESEVTHTSSTLWDRQELQLGEQKKELGVWWDTSSNQFVVISRYSSINSVKPSSLGFSYFPVTSWNGGIHWNPV